MIAELAGVLLPVFALAALGFGWRKSGVPFEREFVMRLVLNVGGPCLIVDSLSSLSLPLADVGSMAIGGVALFLATLAACFAILKLARMPVRTFLPALAIGNTGNLGLSVCFFAFGEEGLGLAIAVFVANSIGQFTLTPILQSGRSPWRTLVTTPVIYGAAIGTTLLVGGYALPEWVASTVEMLGQIMIPLMLVALGHTLAGLRVKQLPFAAFWGFVRLIVGFAVALGVVAALGLEGTARGVLILQGAMPAAVFSYLFAARYDRAPDDVAGIVLLSTIFSMVTLPFVVAWVLGAGA